MRGLVYTILLLFVVAVVSANNETIVDFDNIFLKLDVPDEVQEGETVDLDAVITNDVGALDGKEISYYIDGALIDSDVSNSNGKTSIDIADLSPGHYLLEAKSDNVADQEILYVEEEAPYEPFQRLETCTLAPQKVNKVGVCKKKIMKNICDAENTTCEEQEVDFFEKCILETTIEEQPVCETHAYIVDDVKINAAEYTCSVTEGIPMIVVCDSVFDGNGDGICTSGESCVKYEIRGKSYEKFEKNSKDYYSKVDDKFFLARTTEEVVQ